MVGWPNVSCQGQFEADRIITGWKPELYQAAIVWGSLSPMFDPTLQQPSPQWFATFNGCKNDERVFGEAACVPRVDLSFQTAEVREKVRHHASLRIISASLAHSQ
jgi:hypothetical protein